MCARSGLPSVLGVLTRLFAPVLVAVLVAASVLAWPRSASAHGVGDTTEVRLAQTIAGTELTVVIRQVVRVPGPLRIDVVAYHPVRDLTIAVRVGQESDTVRLLPGRAGSHPLVLGVDEVGPHELRLHAGGELSVLPFRVLVPRAAPWERLVHGGFAGAAALLLGALLAAATARRAPAVLLGGGAGAAMVMALTVALLSARFPPAQPDGALPTAPGGPLGRPYVQARIATTPATPVVGGRFTVRLDLVDGSTGRPVDDLVLHHAALAHLVVTSPDGEFFRHVHPTRTVAGRLAVGLTVDRPGRYLVSAEVERVESGGQLVSGEFTVTGPPLPRQLRDEAVPATVRLGSPVAGRPTTIELDAGRDDLQRWLGMAGHLIVRDEEGGFLGHVHEAGSMATDPGRQEADETVADHGPTLRFTFTFPEPGRYLAWAQYVRDYRIVTVPFVVTVGTEDAR